eukprot:1141970-Pelagomonas_calceolata.AAC.7
MGTCRCGQGPCYRSCSPQKTQTCQGHPQGSCEEGCGRRLKLGDQNYVRCLSPKRVQQSFQREVKAHESNAWSKNPEHRAEAKQWNDEEEGNH